MQQRVYDNEDKIYVEVDLRHTKEPKKIPRIVYYEKKNGEVISIEVLRVLDERPAASLKAGGVGMRYTCMLNGRQAPTLLYWESTTDKWFVERNKS